MSSWLFCLSYYIIRLKTSVGGIRLKSHLSIQKWPSSSEAGYSLYNDFVPGSVWSATGALQETWKLRTVQLPPVFVWGSVLGPGFEGRSATWSWLGGGKAAMFMSCPWSCNVILFITWSCSRRIIGLRWWNHVKYMKTLVIYRWFIGDLALNKGECSIGLLVDQRVNLQSGKARP